MQFFSIIGPLAAIAGLASAIVIPTDPTDRQMAGRIRYPLQHAAPMTKRAEPGFFFCNSADYKGLCFRDQSPFGTCVTVEDDLNDVPDQFGNSVSSVSVNDGTHCTLYRDARCEGASTTVLFPGESDLTSKDFNDVMSSFRCEEI